MAAATEVVRVYGRAWGQGVLLGGGGDGAGRHSVDEDAALTPIFHALARGGWRTRQETSPVEVPVIEADPVEQFRRDPLSAPLPAQPALGPARPVPPSAAPAADGSYVGRRRRAATPSGPEVRGVGRHHRRLVPVED